MGTVVHLKRQINNSYSALKNSVDEKLVLVEERIKNQLVSKIDLVQVMTNYHLNTRGKRLRALLTLGFLISHPLNLHLYLMVTRA